MSIFKQLMAGRQRSANAKIATYLHNSEFSNESYDYVLHLVETGEIHERLGKAV